MKPRQLETDFSRLVAINLEGGVEKQLTTRRPKPAD